MILEAINSKLERHGIWFHSQNLNGKRNGLKGSKWRHGRAWLHGFGNCLNWEWAFFWDSSTAIGFTLGAEEDLKLHVAIWRLFSLWFSIGTILPRRWRRSLKWWDKSWGRTSDIRIFNGHIWFNIHNDTTGWSSRQWWSDFNFDLESFFLGKLMHSSRVVESGETRIAFLEGTYPVRWEKVVHEWRRPRWFIKRMIKFDLKMDGKPIPVPGKGENSWDCEDDAIHSLCTPANNLPEALSHLTNSVLRTRERYGWKDPL